VACCIAKKKKGINLSEEVITTISMAAACVFIAELHTAGNALIVVAAFLILIIVTTEFKKSLAHFLFSPTITDKVYIHTAIKEISAIVLSLYGV
jgi:hypothetical protein